MAEPVPPKPEEILDQARDFARKSQEAANNASQSATLIANELKEIKNDRNFNRYAVFAQIAQACAALITFGIICWQGVEIRTQNKETKKIIQISNSQLEVYKGQLDVASKQLNQSRAADRVAFLQQLEQANTNLRTEIDNPKGIIQRLQGVDPFCVHPPQLSPEDKSSLNEITNKFLGHFERYYLTTLTMNLPEDWKIICRSSAELRSNYCSLDTVVKALLPNLTPTFKEALEKCELPISSAQ